MFSVFQKAVDFCSLLWLCGLKFSLCLFYFSIFIFCIIDYKLTFVLLSCVNILTALFHNFMLIQALFSKAMNVVKSSPVDKSGGVHTTHWRYMYLILNIKNIDRVCGKQCPNSWQVLNIYGDSNKYRCKFFREIIQNRK